MFDFTQKSSCEIEFNVDSSVYSDEVISKVLYWLSSDYIIERKMISASINHIRLTRKDCNSSVKDSSNIEDRISQLFVDFHVREIVRKETEGIRNILYLKAFANCAELEDLRGDD